MAFTIFFEWDSGLVAVIAVFLGSLIPNEI